MTAATSQRFVQVYVASPITNVPEPEQQITVDECDVIVSTVAAYGHDNGLFMEAYDPIQHTPTWQKAGASYSAREVWDIDSQKVLEEADAIIVNGMPGGSSGVGVELTLALGRGLPVLYLYRPDRPVTRMIKGMPTFLQVAEVQPGDQAALESTVRRWLATWMPLLAPGPERRRTTAEQFEPLRADLAGRWRLLDREARVRVLDKVQLHGQGIEHYLRTPLRLASMPAVKLIALAEVLGRADLSLGETYGGRITQEMDDALDAAAAEFEWGQGFVGALRAAANGHLNHVAERQARAMMPARNAEQFNLTQRGEWLRMADAWRAGALE